MYGYCLGMRVNEAFQEYPCEYRERCPYYKNVRLGIALSQPDDYQELDTYNNQQCKYLEDKWKMNTETCETSDAPTDGLMDLLKSVSSKWLMRLVTISSLHHTTLVALTPSMSARRQD